MAVTSRYRAVAGAIWSRNAPAAGARVEWVDAGRGLAIVLVVLFHVAQWFDGEPLSTAGWQHVNEVLATMRMPLFFTLAGLFAGKWIRVPVTQLWRSKLWLFVWVFGLWQLLSLGPYVLGQAVRGVGINPQRELVDTAISWVVPRFELWFVWALAIFFLLNRLLRVLPGWSMLTVAVVLSVIGFSEVLPLPEPGWAGLARYYVFFLLGTLRRDQVLLLGARAGWLLRVLLVLGWSAAALAVTEAGVARVPGVMPALAALGVMAGVSVSTWLQRVRPLRSLGANTLPVYLTHTPFLLLLLALANTPALIGASAALGQALVPLVASLAIAAGLALHRAARGTVLRFLFVAPAWPPLRRRG